MENYSKREAALLNNSQLLEKSFHLTPNTLFSSLSSAVQSVVSKTVALLGTKSTPVEATATVNEPILDAFSPKAKKRETFQEFLMNDVEPQSKSNGGKGQNYKNPSRNKLRFIFREREPGPVREDPWEEFLNRGRKRIKREMNDTLQEDRNVRGESWKKSSKEELELLEKIQWSSFVKARQLFKRQMQREKAQGEQGRLRQKQRDYELYRSRSGQGFTKAGRGRELNKELSSVHRERQTRQLNRPARKRVTLDDEPPQLYDIDKVKRAILEERTKKARVREEKQRLLMQEQLQQEALQKRQEEEKRLQAQRIQEKMEQLRRKQEEQQRAEQRKREAEKAIVPIIEDPVKEAESDSAREEVESIDLALQRSRQDISQQSVLGEPESVEPTSKPEQPPLSPQLQQTPSIAQLPTPEHNASQGSQTPPHKSNSSAPGHNPFINQSPSKQLKMSDIIQQNNSNQSKSLFISSPQQMTPIQASNNIFNSPGKVNNVFKSGNEQQPGMSATPMFQPQPAMNQGTPPNSRPALGFLSDNSMSQEVAQPMGQMMGNNQMSGQTFPPYGGMGAMGGGMAGGMQMGGMVPGMGGQSVPPPTFGVNPAGQPATSFFDAGSQNPFMTQPPQTTSLFAPSPPTTTAREAHSTAANRRANRKVTRI